VQVVCAQVEVVPHIESPQMFATSFTHVVPHVVLQHEGLVVQICVTHGLHVFASFAPVEQRLCAHVAPLLLELLDEDELDDALLDDELLDEDDALDDELDDDTPDEEPPPPDEELAPEVLDDDAGAAPLPEPAPWPP
jgi:hypothetical protein